MTSIRELELPDLGEGLEDAEIVQWHVEVGDVVELNQPVVDVETAKAVVTVPSPFAGTVVDRVGDLGETLDVGVVLLRVDIGADVGADVGPVSAVTGGADATRVAAAADADAVVLMTDSAPSGVDAPPRPLVGYGTTTTAAPRRARPRAKPPVRKLAKDLGVDLAVIVTGSGPEGTITRDDVHAAAERAVTPHVVDRRPGGVEPIRGIRKRIAENMERAHHEIPAASCSRDADFTRLWELRTALTQRARAEGSDVTITPFALVLRAVVVALRRFPGFNARIDRQAGEIHLLEQINLGFAADTDRGLVVPNIKDAHTRSTLELAQALTDLAQQAREGTIRPTDVTGGTFTLTNHGVFGTDDGRPIINHPEVAILGLGAIRERPWVVDGQLAVRRVGRFTLVFDHRVCDGRDAGRFVSEVVELCERPETLLLHR